MGKRVCSEPGCPAIQTEPRCPEHRRQRERARGSRQQRGYDAAHVRLRNEWAAIVARGNTDCARCGRRIEPGMAWDLGHDDHDRSIYTGPECVSCNRATASRRIYHQAHRPRGENPTRPG